MSNVLKGNFQTKKDVTVAEVKASDESVETRFEREALKRLGGSIAFVAKKKVMWDAEPAAPATKAEKAEKAAQVAQEAEVANAAKKEADPT